MLSPLLDSDDMLIREGIRAMLAEQRSEFDRRETASSPEHWTTWQWSDALLRRQLSELQAELAPYQNSAAREAAQDAFDRYAYRWY